MRLQEESRSFLQKLIQSPPTLPFEPALLPLLFSATREDSTVSRTDLVALIERSQRLAVRVLALANSAAYGLEFKVSSLPQAVKILGVREVRLLAVLVGMACIIKETKLPKSFDVNALWLHQVHVAAIAKALAEIVGRSPVPALNGKEELRLNMAPDEAYAAGLLHDIGKVFFAASRPHLWEFMDSSRREGDRRFFEIENDYWGIDHALIGAGVLHHWKLPLMLTEAINWHHEPELAPTYTMEARLLAASNLLAHHQPDAENLFCEEALSLLPEGVDRSAIEAAVARNLAYARAGLYANLLE